MVYVSSLVARGLNRLRLLNIFRVGYTLSILKQTFKIPVIENKEGFIYHLGVGESYLLKVYQRIYAVKSYTFLDAGVNFGQTLLKIKAVHPQADYIGFEPSGLCSYYTSHLIKVNSFANAKLIRCALSNSTGVLTLHAHGEGDTRASLMEGSVNGSQDLYQELVPVVTLDSLIQIVTSAGKDIILKIDVEGAEWLVLQGAQQFIDLYRPLLIFENLPYFDDTEKKQLQQVISDFISNRKYTLYCINEDNKSIDKLDIISNKQEYHKTNYLAVPEEQTNRFTFLS